MSLRDIAAELLKEAISTRDELHESASMTDGTVPDAADRAELARLDNLIDQARAWLNPEPSPDDWVCAECGSDQVQGQYWVELNTDVIQDECKDEAWCPDCELAGRNGYDVTVARRAAFEAFLEESEGPAEVGPDGLTDYQRKLIELRREYYGESDDPAERINACTDPRGHEFECTGTAYGGDDPSHFGEGRMLCSRCGADGDA